MGEKNIMFAHALEVDAYLLIGLESAVSLLNFSHQLSWDVERSTWVGWINLLNVIEGRLKRTIQTSGFKHIETNTDRYTYTYTYT